MAAFSELHWDRLDVHAIVTCRGVATIDERRRTKCLDWLRRNGYEIGSLDCSRGLDHAVPDLGVVRFGSAPQRQRVESMISFRSVIGQKLRWYQGGSKSVMSANDVLNLRTGSETVLKLTRNRLRGDFTGETASMCVTIKRSMIPGRGTDVVSAEGVSVARIRCGCFDKVPTQFPAARRYGWLPNNRIFFRPDTNAARCGEMSLFRRCLGCVGGGFACVNSSGKRLLYVSRSFRQWNRVTFEPAAEECEDLEIIGIVAGFISNYTMSPLLAIDVAVVNR